MYAQRPALCVYCGSRFGARSAYLDAAVQLGQRIGQLGWSLVYGGGNVGLMGEVANAALAAGAPVLGVIPDSLMRCEVGHPGLTEIRVVETMHERKQAMAEAADAFVALPGGIGTFEELFEVWSWQHLGYHRKPVALLNVEDYYAPLLAFMRQTQSEGFVSAEQAAGLQVHRSVDALVQSLGASLGQGLGPSLGGDFSRI
jgi:uncharacterized protein (TIGR00730 family)